MQDGDDIPSCPARPDTSQAHDFPPVRNLFGADDIPVATATVAGLPADFLERTERLTPQTFFHPLKQNRHDMCDPVATMFLQ